MGINYRDHLRKVCLVKDCDCEEFEKVSFEECYNCAYCGCPPAKHKRVDATTDPSSGFTADPKESHVAPTGFLASGPPHMKWRTKDMDMCQML